MRRARTGTACDGGRRPNPTGSADALGNRPEGRRQTRLKPGTTSRCDRAAFSLPRSFGRVTAGDARRHRQSATLFVVPGISPGLPITGLQPGSLPAFQARLLCLRPHLGESHLRSVSPWNCRPEPPGHQPSRHMTHDRSAHLPRARALPSPSPWPCSRSSRPAAGLPYRLDAHGGLALGPRRWAHRARRDRGRGIRVRPDQRAGESCGCSPPRSIVGPGPIEPAPAARSHLPADAARFYQSSPRPTASLPATASPLRRRRPGTPGRIPLAARVRRRNAPATWIAYNRRPRANRVYAVSSGELDRLRPSDGCWIRSPPRRPASPAGPAPVAWEGRGLRVDPPCRSCAARA